VRRVALIGILVLLVVAGAAAAWLLIPRDREPIRVGVVHSLTGPLAVSERPIVDAYRLAAEQINAEGGLLGRPLVLDVRDGASRPEVFASETDSLLRDPRVAVVVGGWSGEARRAMLPVLERHDGLLLYPAPFQGLARSPHVVHLGATPNQELGPALDWAIDRGAKRFLLIGSEGLSSRATNRIAQDMIQLRGVTLVGEEYASSDGRDLRQLAERVVRAGPDCIVSTVQGEENAAVMRALRDAGVDPSNMTIISLSLTEPAIRAMGADLFTGCMLVGGYFRSVDLPSNRRFLGAMRERLGPDAAVGDAMCTAYLGLRLWASAVRDAGRVEPRAVHRAMRGRHTEGPGGPFIIDPSSHHAWRTVHLGRVRTDGEIDLVWDSGTPVAPVPFPMWRSERQWKSMLNEVRASVEGTPQGGDSSRLPASPVPAGDAPSTAPATPVAAPAADPRSAP